MFEPLLRPATTTLAVGDLLLLYTDGVTDAPGRQAMARSELAALVQHHRHGPLEDIETALRETLVARRPDGSADDVVVLALRRLDVV
jgi:serine phosphatase RsbU (regulator of sigma subunit)